VLRRFLKLVPFALLLLGIAAQTVSAQNGERLRQWRAQMQAARQQRAKAANGGGGAKGHPNVRAMEGLPPKWVDRVRDMPPDQQQRFLENNEAFKSLPFQRQQQILRNLDNWNKLSPEEKQAAREREALLERMTPEQREYVRNTLLPKWQAMPQDRRQVINRHLAMLRNMSPATQQAALNDPRFMQGLNPDEQSMLRDLNSLRNPPAPPAQ
jgi:hypothetical protein